MKKKLNSLLSFSVSGLLSLSLLAGGLSSCSFLEQDVPAGTLTDEQVKSPELIDNLVISAYAIFMSAEDINSSFSMWNFDVRSDDAYKGGNGTSDGDVFHQLEISQGILTTNWNISDMWQRLYNCISRVNSAIAVLEQMDKKQYELRDQRIGEMKFLRAYAHFLLKRLYKQIPFIIDPYMSQEQYNELSNTEYSNNEGWAVIARDLEDAYDTLPLKQEEVGRPTKAAAAALLAKVYLYKAYRQDNPGSHSVTYVDDEDIAKVIRYTDPAIYAGGGFALETDFHNNFRPEPDYENGVESIWAIQYSMNDGTRYGNLNWSYGLIVPNIPGVTDGGCDFYKPSQNLVNTFRTTSAGLPDLSTTTKFDRTTEYADPRLFLTVGIPGTPYMFNDKYMIDVTPTWSRSGGLYGYNISLKHNVDPDGPYLIKGKWWGSPMNRIVLRYADVMLMRAEAFALQGNMGDATALLNQLRSRAKASMGMIANYESKYGVHIQVNPYTDVLGQEETLARVKMERRLELAMESERFFDLVRWGDAATVIQAYYESEISSCAIYKDAHFTADKNEYLPIPASQVQASNGHYTQNIGW